MTSRHRGRALLLAAALSILWCGTGRGASLFRRLTGDAPPPDSLAASVPFDTLNARAWADRGFVTQPELLNHAAGFDNGRTGVEGVFRPLDFGSSGRGGLPLTFDGLPGGPRVIHWGNRSWIPVRALDRLEILPGVEGEEPGSAGALRMDTFRPGDRPTSTVGLTGGSYGHRLAELDFERRFGKTDFHADVAQLTHEGFGAFSDVESTRGFLRLDFPMAGLGWSLDGVLNSGRLTYLESFLPEGMEETDERRLAVKVRRPGGVVTATFLHHLSRLEVLDAPDPFALSSGITRIGVEAAPRRSRWTLGVSAARETRAGVRAEDADFLALEGRAAVRNLPAGAFRADVRMISGYREPVGWILDPSLVLHRGFGSTGRFRFSAGRVSTIPEIRFHEGAARPDRDALERILAGLESLESPEDHWTALASAEAGSRLRAGVRAGVVRTANRPLLLNPGPEPVSFRVAAEPEWTGLATGALAWRPSSGFGMEMWAGWHGFDPERHPFRARLRGEGSLTVRRRYFENELDLSATGFLRVAGSRVNTLGDTYPTLLTGGFSLTGRIRTLTLFYRIENAAGIVVESDFLNGDIPVYMPGLHNRIGATLHLLD